MPAELPRLPPWPDRLLDQVHRRDALTWLLEQRLPFWRARQLWLRWGAYVGERATADELHALEVQAGDRMR